MKSNINASLLVLRLSVAGLMLPHGIKKLFYGFPHVTDMLVEKGLPGIMAYGVVIGEVLAPVAMLIGYRTKIASVVFALNCIVAILLAHPHQVFSLGSGGGWSLELLGLYLFGSVALILSGAGNYAISRKSSWD